MAAATTDQPITAEQIEQNGWEYDLSSGDTEYSIVTESPSGTPYVVEVVSVWTPREDVTDEYGVVVDTLTDIVGWTVTKAACLTLTNTNPSEITSSNDAQDYLWNQDSFEVKDTAAELIEKMRAEPSLYSFRDAYAVAR